MLSDIIVESGIVGGPSFDWAILGGFAAVTFCAVVIVASVNGITNTLDWIIARYGRLIRADIIGAVLICVFVFGMVLNNTARATNDEKPTPPPVITVKDIEVKSFKCDHTGLEISWAYGTNVVFGTDKFIINGGSGRFRPGRDGVRGMTSARRWGRTM